MIGLDTNVLLRAVTRDDPVHSPLARTLIGALDEARPGYINIVVLVEFSWSLRTSVPAPTDDSHWAANQS